VKILVINGPNLNMLGKREKTHYGKATLSGIENLLKNQAKKLNAQVDFFQSSEEGQIVSCINNAENYDGVIINAGAYTHTSIAIRDALLILSKPVIEVHLSNIFSREKFRHKSYISDIAVGVIAGFREKSYNLALLALHDLIIGK
jgi:3-dehydroquinate dehydratase-2